jgi:DNA processing protein
MSQNHHWLEAWAAIVRAPGLGSRALKLALRAIPDATNLLGQSSERLRSIGLGPAAADYLSHPPAAEIAADLRWIESSGAVLLPLIDAGFPAQLAALNDAPPALYVLGDPSTLSQPQIAIVGSRTPTAAGRKLAATLARDLSDAGLTITSGLARGIDSAAHEAALHAGGATIAVCGTGLDLCYPEVNRALALRIQAQGALVSEFPPGTGPRAHHFPRRNRIISGLSRGTVVVEAAADSGSLITARRALDQGRELFAIPGSPLNPHAAGCLDLLREGAHLARHASDVLEQINIPIEINLKKNQKDICHQAAVTGERQLDKDYEMLLDALGFESASIDDLVDRTGLAPGSVASMMLILELDGRVETRPGALFNRIAGPGPETKRD